VTTPYWILKQKHFFYFVGLVLKSSHDFPVTTFPFIFQILVRLVSAVHPPNHFHCDHSYIHFQFQARPETVVPQTIPLWPLLQLCISIPGQTGVSCPPNRFHCENSIHCLPITMLCDGVVDCPDRSDEGVFCCKFMILIQNLNALCRFCKMILCLWASISSARTERFIWNFVGKFP
jgi:hypothetical protein